MTISCPILQLIYQWGSIFIPHLSSLWSLIRQCEALDGSAQQRLIVIVRMVNIFRLGHPKLRYTIHHSPNTYIKSIHSALNKYTTCTTISIISKEFGENIIISNYNFLILFLCVSTPKLKCTHTTTICHE